MVIQKVKPLLWMLLIYSLSILALTAVSYGFKWLMSMAGLHT